MNGLASQKLSVPKCIILDKATHVIQDYEHPSPLIGPYLTPISARSSFGG